MPMNRQDWIGLTVSDGRYLVETKLGEGGMGIVYRARDTRLDAPVVIKVPRQAMLADPEFTSRFTREIRSLVTLSHPCIVKVTDVGVSDGLPFAVMQYLPGGSLEDRQGAAADGRRTPVELGAVPGWLPGIAGALDYVHSQGYVHRDVKPGNILFDAQGHAFLGDFGVIKALTSAASAAPRAQTAATGAGMVLGTPEYMAPEMIMGEEVDGRADQYALAVTVYEMLSGRRPFEGASPTAVLVLQTTKAPLPLTDLRPAITGRLSEAVLKGLAKSPAGRFATCTAFASAVIAALEACPADAPGVAATAPSGSESVRIQCPTCEKKIAIGASTFATLKRTGKTFPCPGCQTSIQVASPGTRILSTPPSPADRVVTPASTQKLASPGTQKLETFGTQKIAAPGTQKLEGLGNDDSTASPGSTGRPAATVKIEALNLLVSPETESIRKPAPASKSPSLIPWLGAGAAAAALLVAGVLALRPSGPAIGTVQIQLSRFASGAEIRLDQRRMEARELEKPVALNEGTHLLDVSKEGFLPYQKSFTVGPGNNPGLEVTLTRRPEPRPVEVAAVVPPQSPIPVATIEPAGAMRRGQAEPSQLVKRESNDPSPAPAENVAGATPADEPAPAMPATPPDRQTEVAKAEGPAGQPKGAGGKKGDAEDEVSLGEILGSPDKFGDREVTPRGLFRLGRLLSFHMNGPPTLSVVEGGLAISRQNFAAMPVEGGKVAALEIENGLADKLIASQICYKDVPFNADKAGWEKHVAVLTLRVLREGGMSRGTNWVCRIIKAEFLINLDSQRIGDHKFARAFQTYTISSDAQGIGVGDGEDWQKRLGTRFIADLGKVARMVKTQRSIARSAQATVAESRIINQSVQNAARANAAGEAARRNAMGGTVVVNARSVFDQELNLNADLVRP
jgi:serine/threonine protein kinase